MNFLENFSLYFPTHKEFITNIKERLCEILIKNCICQERQIFIQSFKIFLILVFNYKEHVKSEICLFIEQIFLKILNSVNSSYYHRHASLQVLN